MTLRARAASPPPQSLYLHIPFCVQKCFYCAFNSYAGRDEVETSRYVTALTRHLEEVGPELRTPIETIYVGGGTPTYLSADQLDRLFEQIRKSVPLAPRVEWTVEANPGTLDTEKIRCFHRHGVTRVSMGVQTMDEKRLTTLGRRHLVEDVVSSVKMLREAKLDNFNLDLIYGLPKQSLSDWTHDIDRLLELDPPHISLYALQIEEGTKFHQEHSRGDLETPDEDLVLEMYRVARDKLELDNLHLYEISNFSKPGHESLHNWNYWLNRSYVGLGAGAWGYQDGYRYRRETNPRKYSDSVLSGETTLVENDWIDPRSRQFETILAGLRTIRGVDLVALNSICEVPLGNAVRDLIGDWITRKHAVMVEDRLILTESGRWVLDGLLTELLEIWIDQEAVA